MSTSQYRARSALLSRQIVRLVQATPSDQTIMKMIQQTRMTPRPNEYARTSIVLLPDTRDPSACSTLEARSRGGQSGIGVRENLEHLVEPRDLKNGAHGFLQTGQQKFSSVTFHLLHGLN